MRGTWYCWLVVCALCATLGCRRPSSEWNGSWELNSSKSSYQSPRFTIAISADGEYRWDNGYTSFTFRCDGKDRSIGNNRTQACIKRSRAVLDLIRKENGVKTRVNHWELSAGGRVLTLTAAVFSPTGSVATAQVFASRLSGADDFAGQWLDTTYLQQRAEMNLILDNQVLHIDYPNAGQHIDAPLDGVDTAVQGAQAPDETTYAVWLAGRREFRTLAKRNGKVLFQGSLDLSGDGKIITDSWWNPGQTTGKGTLVYEKK
jgi:hypothetical protein